MNRSLFLKILIPLAAITAVLAFILGGWGFGADRKPNIVFILADDLGWGDLGAYGHPYAKTPHLDQLANEGTLFHRFYVAESVCVPSRAGFMTSRSPATFIKYPKRAGFQGRVTISEILKEDGYATGHFGKWHMGGNRKDRKNGTYGFDKIGGGARSKDSEEGRDAGKFEAAIRFIEKNRDVPFYINIWTNVSHFPVEPHPSLAAVFKDVSVKREDFPKHMQVKFDEAERVGGDLNEGMANYLGDVYSLDLMVGKLVQKLDELGLRDNTIVVFSSDHGPAPIRAEKKEGFEISSNLLGSAGGWRGGKFDYWEGGVRSPFIVRWPGKVPAGKVNETSITSALDWLPTLASTAGIAYDESMFEGEDVSDIWKGADRSRKNPLFWGSRSHHLRKRSMLQGDWKLHVTKHGTVLYNLSKNPEEDVDLSNEYPEIFEKLERKLKDWSETLLNEDGSKAVVMTPADIPESINDNPR